MTEILAEDSGWQLRANPATGMYGLFEPLGEFVTVHGDELAAVRALLDVAESHRLAQLEAPAVPGADGVQGQDGPVMEFDDAAFRSGLELDRARSRRSWWRRLFG